MGLKKSFPNSGVPTGRDRRWEAVKIRVVQVKAKLFIYNECRKFTGAGKFAAELIFISPSDKFAKITSI